MRKIRNNKSLKIIASISVVLFSLVATFSGAIAWFQVMRSTTSNSEGMKVSLSSGVLKSLSFHELDPNDGIVTGEDGEVTSYKFSSEAISTIDITWGDTANPEYNVKTPSLGRYSLLSKTNPLLLVFELNSPTQANVVSIKATAAQQYTASQYESLANADSNPLSWVVKYSSKVITANSMVASDYTIATNTLSAEDHFATIDAKGNLSSFSQNKTFYQGNSTTLINYVCIVLDYYAEAMEYFYAVNLGKTFINDFSHDVPFDIDWSMEI